MPPIMSAFGSGSARGFGRGQGKYINIGFPFVATWGGGRGSATGLVIDLLNNSVTSVTLPSDTNMATIDAENGTASWWNGGSGIHYNRFNKSDGTYASTGGTSIPNTGPNTQHGYNHGSGLVRGDKYFVQDGSASGVHFLYDAMLGNTSWNQHLNPGFSAEESSFQAGKWFVLTFYNGSAIGIVRSSGIAEIITTSNEYVVPIVSPIDNGIGFFDNAGTIHMYDYDTEVLIESIPSASYFDLPSNTTNYGLKPLMVRAAESADTFPGFTNRREKYSAVQCDYGGNTYFFPAGTTSATPQATSYYWGAGAYDVKNKEIRLLGSAANVIGPGYVGTLNATDITQVSLNYGGDIYLDSRGVNSAFFTHKTRVE